MAKYARTASGTSFASIRDMDEAEPVHYVLRLYIIGATPRSMRAVANLRRFCEQHLAGRYELEIIDLREHPTLAAGEQIIAAPTLIKKLPLPLRRLIGDLSETEKIVLGLDLRHV